MTGDMVRSLLRLLTLQASWSHDRLQGIGVAVAAEPLLQRLPGGPDGEEFRRAMGRAAQHFNSHPYLAGLAVGAVTRAELDGVGPERIGRLRAALKGPLGSLGDRIVWAAALPFAASVGLILAARWNPWPAPRHSSGCSTSSTSPFSFGAYPRDGGLDFRWGRPFRTR